MPTKIEFRNIHKESTLSDLLVDEDLNNDNSNASDQDWGLNKNPEYDLQMIDFDDDVNDTEVQDLNIKNEDILHLHDGSDLSRNVGMQHNNEDQHNHFGGPAMNEDNQEEQLEDHVKDDNLDEDVDEDAMSMKEYI